MGVAIAPLHLVRDDPMIEVIDGLTPLRVPVWLHGNEFAFPSRLQTEVRSALRLGACERLDPPLGKP